MAECVCGAWLTAEHRLCPQCGLPAERSAEPERPVLPVARPSVTVSKRPVQVSPSPWREIDRLVRPYAAEGILLRFVERHADPGDRWECAIIALRPCSGWTAILPLGVGTGATPQAAHAAARRQFVAQAASRAL
ncbi:MAG: hypothetical protein C4346_19065, partial [Chloroflexota bacterium]